MLGFIGRLWGQWVWRRRFALQSARGKNLDRLLRDRYGIRRQGWRERLPILGDRAFRRRARETIWPKMGIGRR